MSTQVISIEEQIFRNSVKAVVSELRCGLRFLSGESVPFTDSVSSYDIVSGRITAAHNLAMGFRSVFESSFYCRRFDSINSVCSDLFGTAFHLLTVEKLKSVIDCFELFVNSAPASVDRVSGYSKENKLFLTSKVEVFENDKSLFIVPDTLSGLSVDGFIFLVLTITRLHKLNIYTFDSLYELTQRDLFNMLTDRLHLGYMAAKARCF